MKLDGTIEIAATVPDVWALINDPVSLSACVPGVSDVRQIDDRTFEGSVSASIGPIDGQFAFRSLITRSTSRATSASTSKASIRSRRAGCSRR